MLQARLTEATDDAEEALAIARVSGNREAEGRALNALGTALGMQGEVERGVRLLRESLDIASELGHAMDIGGAWVNIADVLNTAGRTREALEVARQGLEAESSSPWRTVDWLRLSIAEYLYYLGDWDEAESYIPAESRRHTGGTLLLWQVGRATLALGRGDLALAEEALSVMDHVVAGMTEPQFVGPHGIMRAELARRNGDIDSARAAIDDTIDRIEYCSDDLVRITAAAATGLRVEGDAGQLARDRQDADGRAARARARGRADRAHPPERRLRRAGRGGGAGDGGGRVRARDGRATAPPTLWARAAAALGVARPPLPRGLRALARGRGTDGPARPRPSRRGGLGRPRPRAEGGQRVADRGDRVAGGARPATARRGAPRRARRRRLERRRGGRPFGLTPREREVLALVASGATNREIGERLHMAEKTASVHVSRILAKLNVRSRTEAAAVAHRQGLADTASIG